MNLYERIESYLDEMDYSKIQGNAEKMASKATDGTLKVGKEVYTLTFNSKQWTYEVTNSKGEHVTNFNTKKLSQAKKFLKDWLAN